MRRILVDHARTRSAAWRAQGGQRVPLVGVLDVEVEPGERPVRLLELDLLLDSLARESARLAQLVEMRYFGGMTAGKICARRAPRVAAGSRVAAQGAGRALIIPNALACYPHHPQRSLAARRKTLKKMEIEHAAEHKPPRLSMRAATKHRFYAAGLREMPARGRVSVGVWCCAIPSLATTPNNSIHRSYLLLFCRVPFLYQKN